MIGRLQRAGRCAAFKEHEVYSSTTMITVRPVLLFFKTFDAKVVGSRLLYKMKVDGW